MENIVGIDEVGRGPIAGPVAVGVFMLKKETEIFSKVRDSKQLSEKRREETFEKIKEICARGEATYAVAFISNIQIDQNGIAWAIRAAAARALSKLAAPINSKVLLDGGLKAPEIFTNQQTIIKGDEKIPVIAMASIVAKVTRDRLMIKMAEKYPEYGFEKHKGYGTAFHYEMIKKYGLCPIHRRSFLLKLNY